MCASSLSKSREFHVDCRSALILALGAAFSVGVYLVASRMLFRFGFPLDDAWIHQAYARNLALRGEWAFLPGQLSGGSTAPLWAALLAIGYWLKAAPYGWTYFLGGLLLWGLAMAAEVSARKMISSYRSRFPWVGLFFIGEWHLVWAAGSGMETLLFALVVTTGLVLLTLEKRSYLTLGVLIGLSVWLRPDGITLLGPALVVLALEKGTLAKRLRRLSGLASGFGILFAFYLFFNLALAGSPWPNTFYAKQQEYAILQQASFWGRFLTEAGLPLIGAGALLLPGVLLHLWAAVRRRQYGILAGAAWFLGYLALYAWRLPATYQHGRYIMPAMPIFFIWGLIGFIDHRTAPLNFRWRRALDKVWQLSVALVWLGFWLIGAKSFAEDVAFIESEMVTMSRWVAENIPVDALVAAHDIGALGYFGHHDLVDLAGLVSPQVVPFLRDETRLAFYLDDQGVDYLITFPRWYPMLVQNAALVYSTHGQFAQALGGENMALYRWQGE